MASAVAHPTTTLETSPLLRDLPAELLRNIVDRLSDESDRRRFASCCTTTAVLVLRCSERYLYNVRGCGDRARNTLSVVRKVAARARDMGLVASDLPCVVIANGFGATLFDHDEILRRIMATRVKESHWAADADDVLAELARRGQQHILVEVLDASSFGLPGNMNGLRVLAVSSRGGLCCECASHHQLPLSTARHVRRLSVEGHQGPLPEGLTALEELAVNGCDLSDPWLPSSCCKNIRKLSIFDTPVKLPAGMESLLHIHVGTDLMCEELEVSDGWLPASSGASVRCLQMNNCGIEKIPSGMSSLEVLELDGCVRLRGDRWLPSSSSKNLCYLTANECLLSDVPRGLPKGLYATTLWPEMALYESNDDYFIEGLVMQRNDRKVRCRDIV